MATEPLYLLRMRFNAREATDIARRRGLAADMPDVGYLVHMQLKELFGSDAPLPFAIPEDEGSAWTVLAYSARSAAMLREHAQTYADPGIYSLMAWEDLREKPMPGAWRVGQHLGFLVRACPVIRASSAVEGHYRKGAEVDAYLAAIKGRPKVEGEGLDRSAVYGQWLAERFVGHGARLVGPVRMEAFRRERLLRRSQGAARESRQLERPAATLAGEVEITDAALFDALLRHGIGRHRAFGFGMLLLKPPPSGSR